MTEVLSMDLFLYERDLRLERINDIKPGEYLEPFRSFMVEIFAIKCQCCPHMKTSQLIC